MTSAGRRPRVLFAGSTSYDLPLPESLARKWDALSERMDLRVVGRAGDVRGEDERFRLVRVGPPRFAGRFHLALPAVLAAEGRRFRPDVVITQSPYEALCALPVRLALQHRPKLVVEIHGDPRTAARLYGSRPRRLLAGLADRAALEGLRRADGTRALSPFTIAIAREATGREPLAVFPAYTDLGRFQSEPLKPLPAEPSVAWVGVLQRYKNPETFVRAWRLVAARMPEARLVMVGDGPLRPLADGLERDFPGRVRAIPRVPPLDVSRILDASTLLALPSLSEGLGRVAIEAFTRGRPVVGAAVGGIPDIVKPERNGLLVPPDEPEALADALVRVLSDRKLAERLASGAREDAGRFQWPLERYADAVRDLVDRAIAL